MADLIERDAALAWIDCCLGNSLGGRKEFDSGLLQARKFVTSIPAVNSWISCSERLPKSVANKVIVFCTGEDVNDYVGFGHYEKYEGVEVWLNLETGKQFAEWGLTVQKWMPLPEPPENGAMP